MSDISPPPKPSRPSAARQAKAPRNAILALSHESRFIGYVVLGFGLLAVVALIIILLSGSNERQDAARQPQRLVPEMTDTQTMPRPVPKKELYFKRNPDLDAGDITGGWQTNIGKYTAAIQMEKGVYQVILAQPDPYAPRLYSSGTYKILEDIILLTPRLDWPTPAAPKGKKIGYQVLTSAPFPLIAVMEGKKMIWQNPPQSEKRVLVPYKSPLFMDEGVDYVVWQRVN